jgi:septal ring factor EnvC (AmiA/AmiB activator)
VNERLAALQRESQQLAAEARTLLGDLRKLEVERDLQNERARAAEQAAAQAEAALRDGSQRLAALEAQRQAQLPELRRRLVDLYKRGRLDALRVIAAGGLRDAARAQRASAALVQITERQVAEHRATIDALAQQQKELQARSDDLSRQRAETAAARAAAQRAIAAREALIRNIDSRRDLTAQLAGELRVASDRLRQQVATVTPASSSPVVSLTAFRGALDWPVAGRLVGRFGQADNRLGGSAVRNGIEVEAAAGAPVRAVHGGTVALAEPFTGFGTLVILDHGAGAYSLYGYLSTASVRRGATVDTGDEVGRVGAAPAGPPALYFEMRIDGQSVDPVQWLRPR